MSNSNYILLKQGYIDGPKLRSTLEASLEKRFPGTFDLHEYDGPRLISLNLGRDTVCHFHLKTSRTIESYGARRFWEWVETVLRHEMALILGARLGAEGYEERWDPKADQWPTPISYLKECSHLPVALAQRIIIDTLPVELTGRERIKKAYAFTDNMADLMRAVATGGVTHIEQVFGNEAHKAAFSMLQDADFLLVTGVGCVQMAPKSAPMLDLLVDQ